MADDFSWQNSLAAALSEAAAKEPADTPRAAQLATVTTANIPDVRTVIVRAIEGDVLLFHTDRRSAKARHIAETPWVALAWYIPETRMQYRLYGMATEAPERAQSLWADVRPADRAGKARQGRPAARARRGFGHPGIVHAGRGDRRAGRCARPRRAAPALDLRAPQRRNLDGEGSGALMTMRRITE